MADHTIRLTISREEREKLRQIIRKSVSLFRDEEIGGFVRNIKISNCNMSCYIKNSSSLQKDEEEYPRIIIERSVTGDVQWEHISYGKIISISIIRDELTWVFKEDRWDVCLDVGIKFNFDDQEKDILLMAVDSLAGFMELKKCNISQGNPCEFWSLKTDEIESVCRREVII